MTGEKLGAGVLRTQRTFDAATGRITGITSKMAAQERQELGYTWDVLGNLTTRTDTAGATGAVGTRDLTESFTYDNLNRLTSSQVGTGAKRTVTYDALGNITRKSDVGSYLYGLGSAGPHAVSFAGSATFTYDAAGNLTRENRAGTNTRSLEYTPFNKVSRIVKGNHTVTFAYGPERARFKRTDTSGSNTTTTLYVGSVEKVTYSGSLYEYKRYIAGGAALITEKHETTVKDGVSTETESETAQYLLKDHLGSVAVITNALGGVDQELSYDAWGQRRAPDDWTVLALLRRMDATQGRITPYGFTGHEMLDAVGVIHMNGRIYDPTLGRFMQADPVIQFPHYSQSWNRYSYVINNPLAYTDPSGYIFGIIGGIVGGAIGFITCGTPCAIKGAAIGAGLGASADVLIQGGNLGQALLAGVSAAAFTYAGGRLFPVGGPFEKVLLYGLQMGVIGGITTTLQGGNFGNGFIAAGTAALVGGALARSGWYRNLSKFGRLTTSAVAGGTVSRITGGKFANGAMTSAFASLLYSAAEAAAQRGFQEGLSPAEFEARTGMTFEESRFEYESIKGKPFPLTKQDTMRLFTDEAFAQKQVIPKGDLDITYRNILNRYVATTIPEARAGGYARQPWYKNLLHNPFRNTKWVGPYGNLEVVFDPDGNAVLHGPYKGTFNFFSPADVSGHLSADFAPYVKRWWWGN